jgi:hypothetical protein
MEVYFTDYNLFFESIKDYVEEINGTVVVADKTPYLGFCVYYDVKLNEDAEEKAKCFYIHPKYLTEDIQKTLNNSGKLNLCKLLSIKVSIDKLRKEVKANHSYIQDRCGLNPNVGSNLVFVNGNLYTGDQVFDCYKGVGWPKGRPSSIKLSGVPNTADVYYIATDFGKLRKCKYNFETHKWDIVTIDIEDNM